jgi:transketolase
VIREMGDRRDVTLLATGTEVATAVDAAAELFRRGFGVAVVSMPCWELFEDQPASYRAQVLGTAPRVAIEAASKFGWTRYVDSEEAVIGMTGYGASAPAEILYGKFNITAEALIEKAVSLIRN